MCGIFLSVTPTKNIASAYTNFQSLRHRGPDFSSFQSTPFLLAPEFSIAYGFHRLAINDRTHHGNQPFYFTDGSFVICNGEIYNHEALKETFLANTPFVSGSDCEVLLPLYKKLGVDFVNHLEGEFALVIFDASTSQVIAARDNVGIRPLYISTHESMLGITISSELKGITQGEARHFPPGQVTTWSLTQVESRAFTSMTTHLLPKSMLSIEDSAGALRTVVEQSVISRLHADAPIGCFLSGGIDSSAVAALAAQYYGKPISTFTLRIEGLPNEDATYAREVAAHIGSVHHEIVTTLDEIFSLIDEVIEISETFNFEMLPNLILVYLVARYVRQNTDIKVLLDGTGPDEMLGGYWFFRDAPTLSDFESETVKQLAEMHRTELLGDRVVSHFGLEMRYPYLDTRVTSLLNQVPPEQKFVQVHGFEKRILRLAMENLLPEQVVWRKKLGMTHGAGENFENIFDKEIRRRLGAQGGQESHARILGIEEYYKDVFYRSYPKGQRVECNVTALPWRENDPIAIWR
ncbi:asparagine synthase (glutamine-hydrolyzing) [Pseudomonas sp. RGM 3321]|uniref:asparagine synthase (glutamine-hydrolyzing) n=1 Tax=Pseudomonas sp. RGM 3321 TaxID=2930089 RepID=UPI001FCC52A3|nr:asparagine synthase (glutamine-hydrolyzing) [Pseudomonas sp. RGM 3321]MCJ2373870.1 asparagine synthase (glutamine-hydrolyzing) [Pseudomonas sp. RGM 3321]